MGHLDMNGNNTPGPSAVGLQLGTPLDLAGVLTGSSYHRTGPLKTLAGEIGVASESGMSHEWRCRRIEGR